MGSRLWGRVFGVASSPKCTSSNPQPVVSVLFFTAFLVVTSFVMLSLFIGAVTMGMSDSMEAQQAARKVGYHG